MSNEITMFSEISSTGVSAQKVKAQLSTADKEQLLTVRIDSEGGSVFEGLSIYSACQAYEGPKVCLIESAAFSIASYIAMAFDKVQITRNGYMMIHNPSTEAWGDDTELTKRAELLAKLKASMIEAYSDKTKMAPEIVEKMMREETFLNAEEALAAGFVDEIVDFAKPSRVLAKNKETMPYRVVASLGNEASDSGEEPVETKEAPMPESTKIVATVKQIRAKYPKASSDFIVKAMDEEMTMEAVDDEMLTALATENEELKAKISAMEEQLSEKEQEPEPEPAAEEETEETPVAKSRGVAPVARASAGSTNTQINWAAEVDSFVAKGMSRPKAVAKVDKLHPGLRESFLQSINQ